MSLKETRMPKAEELLNHRPKVRLEFGFHEFSSIYGIKNDDSFRALNQGELDNHYWNSAVLERVSGYRPALITSDSFLQLSVPEIITDDPLDNSDKFLAWYTLPGSPSEIRNKDYIYTLPADYFGRGPDESDKFVKESMKGYLTEDISSFLFGVALAVGTRELAKRIPRKSTASTRFSRRNFLRKSALLTAGAVASIAALEPPIRWGSSLTAGLTGNRTLHDMATRVSEITRHRFNPSVWVDGRSALMIAKTLDAVKLLPSDEQEAAVILGFPHTFEANRILHSQELRFQAIRNLVETVSQSIEIADTRIAREELRLSAIDYFSKLNILKVQEIAVNNHLEDLTKLYHSVTLFLTSYSNEVREALRTVKPLGNQGP